jgi:hypothetical protein
MRKNTYRKDLEFIKSPTLLHEINRLHPDINSEIKALRRTNNMVHGELLNLALTLFSV